MKTGAAIAGFLGLGRITLRAHLGRPQVGPVCSPGAKLGVFA